jgi:excisionase family DNA binding protein
MSMVNSHTRMFFGVDEAAFVSGISQRQLFRALKSGELRAAWASGRWRIHRDDLEAFGRGEPMPARPTSLRIVRA